MPAYAQINAFLQIVTATNPTYSRVKTSSLAPLVAILRDVNGTAAQVTGAIATLRGRQDAAYGNKANKYKKALNFLQRTYPIAQNQWAALGATRSRAIRFTQTPMPATFNPYGPDMHRNFQRLQPASQWVGPHVSSVEDFVYQSAAPVGAVLIHVDAVQGGMQTLIDGMTVIDHMKSVLTAIRHRNGNVCALHIGNTQPVCQALQPEFNAFAAPVAVNEPGHRHMGSVHAGFRNFIGQYQTVVVMGFDASICVRGNLFGATEYPHPPVALGTSSLPPITSLANVVTSRALLVSMGAINGAEYGAINGW
jgi:hypothetical protein